MKELRGGNNDLIVAVQSAGDALWCWSGLLHADMKLCKTSAGFETLQKHWKIKSKRGSVAILKLPELESRGPDDSNAPWRSADGIHREKIQFALIDDERLG